MKSIKLLLLDCDGVLTDNRVWVDSHGNEMVAFNRSDGLGIAEVKKRGVIVAIVTSEQTPGKTTIAELRARKLGIDCYAGVVDKGEAVKAIAAEHSVDLADVAFIGNDINDLPALEVVGWPMVVACFWLDAPENTTNLSDFCGPEQGVFHSLDCRGGHGAVREVCDLICEAKDA
jgi:N-acylneuraminate cytidylyltransferase